MSVCVECVYVFLFHIFHNQNMLLCHSCNISLYFLGEDYFEVSEFKDREAGSAKFPLHYDLPVKEFSDTDKPWLYDFLLS